MHVPTNGQYTLVLNYDYIIINCFLFINLILPLPFFLSLIDKIKEISIETEYHFRPVKFIYKLRNSEEYCNVMINIKSILCCGCCGKNFISFV